MSESNLADIRRTATHPAAIAAAALFALMATAACHIHVPLPADTAVGEAMWGTLEEVTVSPASPLDIPLFAAAFSASLAGICLLAFLAGKASPFGEPLPRKKLWQLAGISAVLMLLAWLPYLLAFFPGCIFSDTIDVIRRARGFEAMGNRHTVLYVLEWRACFSLAGLFGGDGAAAVFIMTLAQYFAMAATLAYAVCWLARKGARLQIVAAVLAFFMLFPLFPLYVTSLWKDTFFSAFMLLYALTFMDLCLKPDRARMPGAAATYVALSLLVAFSRNNGVYVVLACTAALILALWRWKARCRMFAVASACAIAMALAVQGPVYTALGWQTDFYENLGIPLQQIGRTVACDQESLSAEQREYFGSLLPLDQWTDAYRPLIDDSLKWSSDFNPSVIDQSKSTFIRHYLQLGFEHPGRFLEAWLLATSGFWDPLVGTTENFGYVHCALSPNYDTAVVGVELADLVEQATGIPAHDLLQPRSFISPAAFAWLMLLACSLACARGRKRAAFGILPLVILWALLLVSTPIAYSLRYCYALVMAVPLLLLLPWLGEAGASGEAALPHEAALTPGMPERRRSLQPPGR